MRFFKSKSESNFLIVGLGNPGKKYQNTRHNTGFEALDFVSKEYGIKVSRSRFSSLVGEGYLSGVKIVLIKPMTFMNLSGQAVTTAASYYGIPTERILVLCDDVALPCGVFRIRAHGSSGGQKGLQNIEDMLESQNFMRIRIGIGHPTEGEMPGYVLSIPTVSEKKLIHDRFFDIAKAITMILEGDLQGAQSQFN